MIKIRKPKRYANMCKISEEAVLNDDLKFFKENVKILTRLPKNTLRCKFITFHMGRMFDDFAKSRYTLKAEFEIIRFKR